MGEQQHEPGYWGIDNDYGTLRDVLLGKPDYFRWVEAGPLIGRTLQNQHMTGVEFDFDLAQRQQALPLRSVRAPAPGEEHGGSAARRVARCRPRPAHGRWQTRNRGEAHRHGHETPSRFVRLGARPFEHCGERTKKVWTMMNLEGSCHCGKVRLGFDPHTP